MPRSESPFPPDPVELLAGETLGDLDVSELDQLDAVRGGIDPGVAEELHRTAAALQLVMGGPTVLPMPTELRSRIASQAVGYVAANASSSPTVVLNEPNRSVGRRERMAWLIAAAAVLFAIVSPLYWMDSGKPNADGPLIAVGTKEARQSLIAEAPDLIQAAWSPGPTPLADATGDVVWSNTRQRGFIRFVGLPINDPGVQQYQLWIIDPLRDDEPIDGGVFDIDSTGEVIIAIDAKLRVIRPAAFAVTVEKPGGVVVSDQSRLPLIAKL